MEVQEVLIWGFVGIQEFVFCLVIYYLECGVVVDDYGGCQVLVVVGEVVVDIGVDYVYVVEGFFYGVGVKGFFIEIDEGSFVEFWIIG